MSKTTILLADDHPLFIKGLARFFSEAEDFELVGTASRGDDAWALIQDLKPDVAVIDLMMPGMSGVEICEQVTRNKLPVKILLLTGSNQTHLIYTAVAAGASGYIVKTAEWEDIALALKQIAEGGTVLGPEIMTIVAGEIRKRSDKTGLLTARERDVISLISVGNSVAETAEALSLSPDTIKGHLKSIYDKLDVRNQAAAVAEAIRKGLI